MAFSGRVHPQLSMGRRFHVRLFSKYSCGTQHTSSAHLYVGQDFRDHGFFGWVGPQIPHDGRNFLLDYAACDVIHRRRTDEPTNRPRVGAKQSGESMVTATITVDIQVGSTSATP